MREIKFKYYLDLQTHIHTFVFTLGEIEQRRFTHDEKIVVAKCQCTGLKDKNGKEIYEGDKIRFEAMGEWGEGVIEHYLHVFHVMWDKNNFKSHDMFTSIKYLGCPKEIEVIGNIHD